LKNYYNYTKSLTKIEQVIKNSDERVHAYVAQAWFPFKRNRLRCVRCVNEFHATNASASQSECSVEAVATMIGCLPTQAIAFEWKPGFTLSASLFLLTNSDHHHGHCYNR